MSHSQIQDPMMSTKRSSFRNLRKRYRLESPSTSSDISLSCDGEQTDVSVHWRRRVARMAEEKSSPSKNKFMLVTDLGGATFHEQPCKSSTSHEQQKFGVMIEVDRFFCFNVEGTDVFQSWARRKSDGLWTLVKTANKQYLRETTWVDCIFPSKQVMTRSLILFEVGLSLLPFVLLMIDSKLVSQGFFYIQCVFCLPLFLQVCGIFRGMINLLTPLPVGPVANFNYGFLIAIYGEPIELLRETLRKLAEHEWSKDYLVVLAFEERGDNGKNSVILTEEFGKVFRQIVSTFHPRDIPGEFHGKATNCDWGARQLASMCRKGELTGISKDGSNLILSCIDADSCFPFEMIQEMDMKVSTRKDPSKCFMLYPTVVKSEAETSELLIWADTTEHLCQLPVYTIHPIPHGISAFGFSLKGLIDHIQYWGTGFEAAADDEYVTYRAWLGMNESGKYDPVIMDRPFYSSPLNSDFLSGLSARGVQHSRHCWGMQNVPFVLHSAQVKQRNRFQAFMAAIWMLFAQKFTITMIPLWSIANGAATFISGVPEKSYYWQMLETVMGVICLIFVLQHIIYRQISESLQGAHVTMRSPLKWIKWFFFFCLSHIPIVFTLIYAQFRGYWRLYHKTGIKWVTTDKAQSKKTN